MKRSITLAFIALCYLTTFNASAQNSENSKSSGKAYSEGDVSLNAGISLGTIGYGWGYGWSSSFSLPLTATLDIGVHEYFSVGGYAGYMGRSYKDAWGGRTYKHTFRSYNFGVQGTFHASSFLNSEFDFNINDTKVDYYVRLLLGYEVYSWKYDDSWNNSYINYNTSSGRMIFGPVVGVRYMFSPNVGGYIEGGRGAFGWLTLGVSFKM
mgnify:CR=1 FL=1